MTDEELQQIVKEWLEISDKDPDLAKLVDFDTVVGIANAAWLLVGERMSMPVNGISVYALEASARSDLQRALHKIRVATARRIEAGKNDM